jgi:hypothetical protein
MTGSEPNLETQVQEFASDVATRVLMCLEGAPQPNELTIESNDGRFVFTYRQTLHAIAGEISIGIVQLDYALGFDRAGRHLAVHNSSFQLKDRRGKKPIVRIEYVRDARTIPCSHVHVHGESGLFTEFLAATGHKSAAAISSIHVPTGGDRFRPCIEDFVQFLIEECGVAGREGWRDEVFEGREAYRQIQTAAAVRDRPEVAIAELKRLGLSVTGELDDGRPEPRSRY